MALGAQAGQMKLTEVIKAGGFTQVRRVACPPDVEIPVAARLEQEEH